MGANDQDRTGDLILTMDVLYQLSYIGWLILQQNSKDSGTAAGTGLVERKTGLEPATLSLEG
jgi:hypothetical protein